MRIDDHGDIRVLHLDPDGPVVSTSDDASDLIGSAWSAGVQTIAIPVSRLDPEFFDLSSRKAGDITQKLVNYRLRLVVLGDVSAFEAASGAFRDYVWESNRGDHVWFLTDRKALTEKLTAH
jgi:Domain of unknown function (DUF4180)